VTIVKKVAIWIALLLALTALVGVLGEALPDPWGEWAFLVVIVCGPFIAALGRRWTGWPPRKDGELRLPIRGTNGGDWNLKLNDAGDEPSDVASYLEERHGIDSLAVLGAIVRIKYPLALGEAMSHDEAKELARELRQLGAAVSMHFATD